MKSVFLPSADVECFFRDAIKDGYSMEERLVDTSITDAVSHELEREGYLVDMTELIPSYILHEKEMTFTSLLHNRFNKIVGEIVNDPHKDHFPLFSVRVFEPGIHCTTVHRNHPIIGPWAVGITLRGNAPFNVYNDDVIDGFDVLPLLGDEADPKPSDSMQTEPGSGWILYTRNELVPHSGGIVNSSSQRELIIFYDNNGKG